MSLKYKLQSSQQDLYLKRFTKLSQLNQVPPPDYIVWDCTHRCNLNCIHCSANQRYSQELSTIEVKSIIDQLAAFNVKTLQITGGEPMLRADMLELLDHAYNRGLKTELASNGFLITGEVAHSLNRVNIQSIQISLDGLKDTHNRFRQNPNSFNKAVSALENLKNKTSIKTGVATTVVPDNVEELPDLCELLKLLQVDFWQLGLVLPIGRARSQPQLLPTPKLILQLIEFVINYQRDVKLTLGEGYPFLGTYDPQITGQPRICPVGILSCCVGVDGYIRGCVDMPDTKDCREGHILKDDLRTIWKDKFVRYRNDQITKFDSTCRLCAKKISCRGGCRVLRSINRHCINKLLP